ncbi:hypothetical protein [Desulfobacula sp.]|jgi:hypothetical protein
MKKEIASIENLQRLFLTWSSYLWKDAKLSGGLQEETTALEDL